MESFSEKRLIIPELQNAFRTKRNCMQHVFALHTIIEAQVSKPKGKVFSFFLDIRKAFDSVPHELILNLVLKYMGLSIITNLISNFYSKLQLLIKNDEDLNNLVKVNIGLPQREPLSFLIQSVFSRPL